MPVQFFPTRFESSPRAWPESDAESSVTSSSHSSLMDTVKAQGPLPDLDTDSDKESACSSLVYEYSLIPLEDDDKNEAERPKATEEQRAADGNNNVSTGGSSLVFEHSLIPLGRGDDNFRMGGSREKENENYSPYRRDQSRDRPGSGSLDHWGHGDNFQPININNNHTLNLDSIQPSTPSPGSRSPTLVMKVSTNPVLVSREGSLDSSGSELGRSGSSESGTDESGFTVDESHVNAIFQVSPLHAPFALKLG